LRRVIIFGEGRESTIKIGGLGCSRGFIIVANERERILHIGGLGNLGKFRFFSKKV